VIIAVDIGNSSINIGYFTDEGLLVQKNETHPPKSPGEYRRIVSNFLLRNHIEKKRFGVIISSVVSGFSAVFEETFRHLAPKEEVKIITANHKMESGLILNVNNPEALGTDRIANAVAAFSCYGGPVAVVDFGTATTITVVDRQACLMGGAIMPGIGLMNEELEKGTSKLAKVDLEPPVSALGKDTSLSILAGLFYGTAGAVEKILSEVEREEGMQFSVVVTGGYGQMMAKFMGRRHEMNPSLTLEGLKILYEKNNRPS
jgi:type III pantothenate kinase